MQNDPLTPLRTFKALGRKIVVLTGYDYPLGKLLDEAGVDVVLVGDSLGMVVLGYPDTTFVTLDDILHHLRATVRGVERAAVLADLPFNTYNTPEQAVATARRLMEAGANAVKLEGGVSHAPQIRAIVEAGIPIVGHIGMLPQQVRVEGGYKIKGKTEEEIARLIADAKAVEEAGALAVVVELVRPDAARQVSQALRIPTIGIGAGEECDGQVLVTHDLVGLFPWFTPKFVTPTTHAGEAIRTAAGEFVAKVRGLGK